MSSNRRAIGFFAAAFTAVLTICFFRRPEMLLTPQFFAEDGSIFFRDAYQLPFWNSISLPVAGYYLFFPRLIAAAAVKLGPLNMAPFLFNGASLLVAAAALSLPVLPAGRVLIASDPRRALVFTGAALLPYQECLGKLAYLQWYILWIMAFSLLIEPPRIPRLQAGAALLYLAAAFSAALQLFLLPLIAARIILSWRKDRVAVRYWLSLLLISIFAFVYMFIGLGSVGALPWEQILADKRRIVSGLIHGLSYYGPVASITGEKLAHATAAWSWRAIYILAALYLAWNLYSLKSAAWNRRLLFLLLFFPACGFILRPQYIVDHGDPGMLRIHTRYYLIALLAGYLLFFSAAARMRPAVFYPLLLLSAALHSGSFALFPHYLPLPPWSDYAAQIRQLEASGQPGDVTIPIAPPGWQIKLTCCTQY